MVAALAKFFSDFHVLLPYQSGQKLPSSSPKRETPNISMGFSSTVGISSMSLSTVVSVPYSIMVNYQHGLEETDRNVNRRKMPNVVDSYNPLNGSK